MTGFLRELAACQNVSQAARAVGMGRQSAYKLRNRMAGTPFALAWEVALENGLQQLAHSLMDRALNGEEVPVFYHGEQVGSYRRHDNRLGAWLLENPWKLGRHQVARETMSQRWDALLARIEAEGPGWDPEDLVETPEIAAQSAESDEEYMSERMLSSWYEAHPAKRAAR